MTPQEINVAIAEARGFVFARIKDGVIWGDKPDKNVGGGGYSTGAVPDYFHDLNAMHEAEESLTDQQHKQFRENLAWVVGERESPSYSTPGWRRRYASATAAQRATAFCPHDQQMEGDLTMKTNKTKLSKQRVIAAREKALKALDEYTALLPKPANEKSVAPRAIMRGICGASFAPSHNMVLGFIPFSDTDSCVVIPCATCSHAAALVAWHNKTEEQQVEEMAKALARDDSWTEFGWDQSFEREKEPYRKSARAILTLWQPRLRKHK